MKLSAIKSNYKQLLLYATIAIVLLASVYFIYQQKTTRLSTNPAFAEYISAYTTGVIPKKSSIRIQLTTSINNLDISNLQSVFNFEPSMNGKVVKVDEHTLEFIPHKPLVSGTKYIANVQLSKLVKVPDDLSVFSFEFTCIKQDFEVQEPNFEALDSRNLVYQKVYGTLLTADEELAEQVLKLMSATVDGKEFPIKWEHSSDNLIHKYTLDSVERKESPTKVEFEWDGSSLTIDQKGKHELLIPSLGDFKVVRVELNNNQEQYISIRFSDPISSSQDLTGLIYLKEQTQANMNAPSSIELRYLVEGNEVKCYPGTKLFGKYILNVNSGVQNSMDYKMEESFVQELDFEQNLPSLKFLNSGVIIPASNKLLLPFEASSLNAIDVTIVKVFENNITQFFQVNGVDGNYQMHRVGRPILKQTIRLDDDRLLNLNKVNQYAIQLDKLIKPELGAIYNIKLSFKKKYAVNICTADSEDSSMEKEEEETEEDSFDSESSYWSYYDDYSDDYDWRERDNPCHNSYYNSERWAIKNIIASDIGFIAKKSSNGSYQFIVSNLITTKPLSNVSIELIDYQKQVIAKTFSNAEGFAQINSNQKAYLAIASYNKQKSYIKLDDGQSLSNSRFDVSGDVVQKGIKGFIYGERGVWRPGDSIYLSFILEDKQKVLPKNHPVMFDLLDPNGVLYKRTILNNSLGGFYCLRTCTDPTSITGNWNVKVSVGGIKFYKSIKIETVMPNRLKIELAFNNKYLKVNGNDKATLKSRWLHGAVANELKTKVDVNLNPVPTTFQKYPDFNFDDPTRYFTSELQTIYEGKLNNKGEVQISPKIQVENRPAGMLQASFIAKVFESGGNFSIDKFSMPYHAFESYIGIKVPSGDAERGMLLTDTTHAIKIVHVNTEGELVKTPKKLKLTLYKISWSWWWDKSEEDLSSYANNQEHDPIQEADINLVNGVATWKLKIKYPEWGRYLLRVSDENGHSSGKIVYIDWPGWAGRAQRDNPSEATMLSLSSDKTNYKVGETCTIVIPSSKNARALVSIENGTGVIEKHWVETTEGNTKFSFKITKEMLPNIYVNTTLIQAHAQTINDLPIRMYGLLSLSITDPSTILKPIITANKSIKPDEENSIKISEANGKPMYYTLAIVDEGLLDLTRFKTPDPYAKFYAKEALGVKTWDIYDNVMGAFGVQMNRILSIGGDDEINKKSGTKKANRFVPTVTFLGPFKLESNKQNKHLINIKNYVGSVKVMVVAAENGAYGAADKVIEVKKPLMVLASLPRVLSPGEIVSLPISVFSLDSKVKSVNVTVKNNDAIQLLENNTKNISFTKVGDEMAYFKFKVNNKIGIAKIEVLVNSGKERANYKVEIDVRNPNPYVTNVSNGIIEAQKSWIASYSSIGISGTNSAYLEVSSIPALNLEKRLSYLINYPHGCLEQTTSSVFPQLALTNLLELSAQQKNTIEQHIKLAINKIKSFQTTDGGLSYWNNESNADAWVTSYAGHFLIEAENAGYAIPINLLSSWKKYQKSKALLWTSAEKSEDDLIQAYRLYTLAIAKSPELGAMNRLKELKNLSIQATWRLAAAYAITGQKSVALNMINKLPLNVKKSQTEFLSFGSELRDKAMILETLVLLGKKDNAYQILEQIAKELGSDAWLSTQSTSYALISIAKLTGMYKQNEKLSFTYVLDGNKTSHNSSNKIAQYKLPVNSTAKKVVVSNTSNQLLYARLISKGKPAIGNTLPSQKNINIEVRYKDLKNKPINVSKMNQGTDFIAEVTISNPGQLGAYKQLALTQIFPSGWEIINTRLDNSTNEMIDGAIPRYKDIRDDRVMSYFSLNPNQKLTFKVLLNASYLGKYYFPSTVCEEMYNGNIYARSAGSWVEVVQKVK
jgi:uncharacterized protein YfaS (alpha-2-macroglobulin family)